MKRMPWLPLDANFQDDPQILGLSIEAELVFIRSLAMAKRLDTGGVIQDVSLRRLCDKALTSEAELAAELVDSRLWSLCETSEVEARGKREYAITGWEEWNVSNTGNQSRKREGAKLGNHRRYGHKGPVGECQICNPDDVSPGGSLELAKRGVSESLELAKRVGKRGGSESLSDRSATRLPRREDESREDENRKDDNQKSAFSTPPYSSLETLHPQAVDNSTNGGEHIPADIGERFGGSR